MATSTLAREYRRSTVDLEALVSKDLELFWRTLDFTDARGVARALEAFLPELVQAYGDVAATLAADYFDELMESYRLIASAATLAPAVDVGKVQAVARWGVGPLFGASPDPLASFELLAAATHRLVLQPGRDTIHENSVRNEIGYARVPSGKEPCAFCLYLAALGPIWGTKQAAGAKGNEYHTKCYCVPTPMRSEDDAPEDYDLAGLKRIYDAHATGNLKETTAAFREALHVR